MDQGQLHAGRGPEVLLKSDLAFPGLAGLHLAGAGWRPNKHNVPLAVLSVDAEASLTFCRTDRTTGALCVCRSPVLSFTAAWAGGATTLCLSGDRARAVVSAKRPACRLGA